MGKDVKFKIKAEDKTKGAFKSVGAGLKSMQGAVVGLIGAAGIGAAAKQTLQMADEIGKLADRAGIATDRIQTMAFGFELAGVGTEAVNKAMLTFGKRLGKARQGIGALAGGLKGGQEELLSTLKATDNVNDALNVTFQAMGKAKNQAEKLAIADAAFGSAGLRMTAAFRDGSEAFFAAEQQARDLGIVIDEDLIRSAEAANDQILRVSKVISVAFANAFLTLAPTINKAAEGLLKFTIALKDVSSPSTLSGFERFIKLAGAGGFSIFEKLGEALDVDILRDFAKEQKEALFEQLQGAQEAAQAVEGTTDAVINLKNSYTDVGEAARLAGIAQTEAAAKTKHMDKLLKRVNATWRVSILASGAGNSARADALIALNAELIKEEETLKRIMALETQTATAQGAGNSARADRIIAFNEKLEQGKALTEEFQTAEEKFITRTTELQDLMGEGAISVEIFDRAMADAIKNTGEALDKSKDKTGDFGDELKSVMDSASKNLTTSVIEMKFSLNSLGEFFSTVMDDIARKFIQAGIDDIFGQLLGAIGGGDKKSGGGGGGFLSGIGSLLGFASGGHISGPAIVGENGPELFVPNSVGRITPNHETKKLGGGGDTVNLINNFTINALDSRSVAELISQGEPNRVIVGSVQKAFNRMGKKAAMA